jgi:hypothetical protein
MAVRLWAGHHGFDLLVSRTILALAELVELRPQGNQGLINYFSCHVQQAQGILLSGIMQAKWIA